MRTSSFLAAISLLASSSLVLAQTPAQACNGYPSLCAKPYSEVSYATTHNAYAYTPPGALAANQDNDIPTQLKDGIRAFMLDAYMPPSGATNDIELCHTSCSLLDAGPLSKVLGQMKTFMDANPNEVITIFWENAGNLAPAQFQTVYTAAGLSDYIYTQPVGNTTWPTLASMIASKKRLVNFIDDGADASVPWLMEEYNFVFETPYAILKGAPYPCTVDRPKDQRKQLYVLNHFISSSINVGGQTADLPQPGLAAQTNGPDLVGHINDCQGVFSQNPTYVAVDFYEKGQILQLVAQLNGVTYTGKGATQPSTTTSAGGKVQSSFAGALVAGALGLLTL
ncbi:hypothetical protein CPC16_012068 [Podila verticillata]|uniref:Phosphatidylinositol-specific phospholipase C X domain-containing protein n=1 Tax=Podila verticillata NRRL 6337 TaxID=1069443 RepID=A0A086TKZ5_9FUNG|nr:hypothetical protein BGZ52_005396 [Haplosporangium bisporale]KAF9376959.1 hypothetical protein CPC16_012068 [Podila verticillata]KFH62622.1 hypothetical protein MVEG_12014 [Podila verticillata NRRL 6337]